MSEMGFRARFFVQYLSHNNNEMLFLFPWMTFLVLDFTHTQTLEENLYS